MMSFSPAAPSAPPQRSDYTQHKHTITLFKVALISIFRLTMGQMMVCDVKDVTHSYNHLHIIKR